MGVSAPLLIGSHRQLFLDDWLIERNENLARRVCSIVKHPDNPVIRREEQWEPRDYLLFGSVLHDAEEGLWKAWADARGEGVFYFTSADGVHWERPQLDLFPLDGRPTNRVLGPRGEGDQPGWGSFLEFFGVTKDPDEPDPERRYRMGWLWLDREYSGPHEARFHPGQRRGLGVAFGPDGIHWTPLDEPATYAICDGQTHWFRDDATGEYVLYGRTKHVDEAKRAAQSDHPHFANNWGRAVARVGSPDFVHWTPEEGKLVLTADALDGPLDETYSMGVFPYEGLYIGLVQVYHNYPDGVWLEIQLAVSRDSVRFERLSDRSPFIPVGEVGAWDRFNNSAANNGPITVGDHLRFYYSGRSTVHGTVFRQADDGQGVLPFDSAIGFGTILRDRFVALEAGFDGGMLRTKPLICAGSRLHLNAGCRFGIIDVTLLGEDGAPLGLATVQGTDGIDVPVELPALAQHAGRPVRLEFRVRNAQLYSFWSD